MAVIPREPVIARYHLVKEGPDAHRARLVPVEDKYGDRKLRCCECPYERPLKDEDE